MDDRSAVVKIGGKEYELLLTTRATREIAARYGGLDALGDKLLSGENVSESLDEVIWLIAELANQPILIHNLRNPGNPKPLLTAEEIELLTAPADLTEFREAIMTAMVRGTRREIESEPGKNPVAG